MRTALGVVLRGRYDTNYPDNVAGIDGRNPKWQLDLLGVASCEN